MGQLIYIKTPQSIEIKHTNILLKDVLTIYTADKHLSQYILSIPLYTFQEGQKQQLVVSVLKIIETITKELPDVEIQNLGEEDIVVNYVPIEKNATIKENLFTLFICLVAFFGGGYAIMAYNTDAGAKELFTYLSMLFLGNATTGVTCLVVTYSIGLTMGMLLFFNHFGPKKLTSDPTPLEIQMRLYENDINTTIIKEASRFGETLDIKE